MYEEANRRKSMRAEQILRALSNLESAKVPLADQLIALNQYR